jgi:uncharacterized protein
MVSQTTPDIPRHVRPHVIEALRESRAVAILGARQAGKSTLLVDLAENDYPAEIVSLDDRGARQAAQEDPTGFVARLRSPAAIDEIQRVPDLLLAIKQRLDHDNTRGQFLLTGSANILNLPRVLDALPGRVDYLNLWPFSQGELRGTRESFIDRLLQAEFPAIDDAPVGRAGYAETLVRGGYPEAQHRSMRSLSSFFSSYIASIIGRDVPDAANLRGPESLDRLLRVIAARSGGLASFRGMGSEIGLDNKTIESHTRVLENLFLVRRLSPWYVNLGARQIKSPKLYLVDSGLLCSLLGANEQRIDSDGGLAGAVFESFVAMELLRQADWAQAEVSLFHYRDNQKREVDVVIETNAGDIAGVEVKAGATVDRGDFAGLRHLRDKLGEKFKGGVVLYTGARALPFGERLAAVPMNGLWEG